MLRRGILVSLSETKVQGLRWRLRRLLGSKSRKISSGLGTVGKNLSALRQQNNELEANATHDFREGTESVTSSTAT
jgi:hypothetical protein